MSNKTFHLTIARVDQPLFAGAVVRATVPGVAGEMTILPDHTALISPLGPGTVRLTTSTGDTQEYDVATGTLEVSDNSATILL
jgi:F-type H+-transporting ATPase subunit epsilon